MPTKAQLVESYKQLKEANKVQITKNQSLNSKVQSLTSKNARLLEEVKDVKKYKERVAGLKADLGSMTSLRNERDVKINSYLELSWLTRAFKSRNAIIAWLK
jgi:hypothetical protein